MKKFGVFVIKILHTAIIKTKATPQLEAQGENKT